MTRSANLAVAFAALLLLIASAVMSPGTAHAQDAEADVEAAIAELAVTFNAGDAEAFAALFSDQGIIEFIGDPEVTTPEEAIALLPEVGLGESVVEIVEIRELEVTGDTAVAVVLLSIDEAFLTVDRLEFTLTGGQWLITGYESGVEPAPLPEIPEGYETIPVGLDEYDFIVDTGLVDAGDLIAFHATNIGEEPHEIVFLRIPAGIDLEEALEGEEGEFLAFTLAEPGAQGIAIVEDAITPGRYVMICFVETAEGVPHYTLGMLEDFTVQAPATPTATATTPPPTVTVEPTTAVPTTATVAPSPPSTGTGLDDDEGRASRPLLVAVILCIVALSAGAAFVTQRPR